MSFWRSAYHGYSSSQFSANVEAQARKAGSLCPYRFKKRPNKSTKCKGCLRKNKNKCIADTGVAVVGPIGSASLGHCLGVK